MRTTLHPTARAGALVAALALGVAGLAGCAASGQSRTDACIIVAQGLEDVQEQIAGANSALAEGDLATMGTNLESAAAALGDLGPEVTNADVSPILSALQTAIESVRDAVADAGSGDADAVSAALDASAGDLQNAALRFNDTCGA